MSVLIVRSGSRAGERILVEAEIVIGREGADVTLEDAEISRRHAVVRPCEGGVEIEDLDSKNGTWVDGRRVEAASKVTKSGATIQLGDTTLEFELEPDDQPTRMRVRQDAPTPVRAAATATAGDGAPTAQPVKPFRAFSPSRRRERGIASRLYVPTALSFAAIAGTAAALIVYFAGR